MEVLIFMLSFALSGSILVALVMHLNHPQMLTPVDYEVLAPINCTVTAPIDYSICNFKDLYNPMARRYMAELVANATANCRHLSCAQNLTV
jgi:hypothetical protein